MNLNHQASLLVYQEVRLIIVGEAEIDKFHSDQFENQCKYIFFSLDFPLPFITINNKRLIDSFMEVIVTILFYFNLRAEPFPTADLFLFFFFVFLLFFLWDGSKTVGVERGVLVAIAKNTTPCD